MTVLFSIVLFLFLLTSFLLAFIVLIQEAKSLGLGASFGGDSSDSLFGTSTADVLKKATACLIGIFLAMSLVLSLMTTVLGKREDSPPPVQMEFADP